MTERALDPDEPTTDEQKRMQRLRHNSSFDPENKTLEELNPMEADSWAGGAISPEAKAVARGEIPANQPRGPNMPPKTSPPIPPSVTRPWAPDPDDPDTDPGGRPRPHIGEG